MIFLPDEAMFMAATCLRVMEQFYFYNTAQHYGREISYVYASNATNTASRLEGA